VRFACLPTSSARQRSSSSARTSVRGVWRSWLATRHDHTLHHALPAGYANGRRFRTPGGPPRLVFVGRFVAKKGLNTLIEACAILAGRGIEFSCHLYGDGEERFALSALIAALSVTRIVHLENPIPNQAFYSTMSPEDVFVSPCRYRPMGSVTASR
jgi:glycosyltransferase involved in cell wall biosynthesis